MPQVVVAFEIVGDTPSKGGYMSNIVASRHRATGEQPDRFQLVIESASPSDPSSLSASFDGLLRFIDGAPVVTHDDYNWKRFVRHALRERSSSEVKAFLDSTVDVSEWSATTFPKQRKDLVSILKRLDIELDSNLTGIDRDSAAVSILLPWVVPQSKQGMTPSPTEEKLEKAPPLPMTTHQVAVEVVQLLKLPLHQRIRCAWRILLGHDREEICA